MATARTSLLALVALCCGCMASPAIAQSGARPAFTKAAEAQFEASTAEDSAFADGAVSVRDVIVLADQCMELAQPGMGYWPKLKADDWLLESGRDIPDDYGWEGVFIKRGVRGRLVEHISQIDFIHCEARGALQSAAMQGSVRDAVIKHYQAVSASEFKGENGFVENIRGRAPQALPRLYVTSQNAVFSLDHAVEPASFRLKVYIAPGGASHSSGAR